MDADLDALRSRLPGEAIFCATKLGLSLLPSLSADRRGALLGHVAAMTREASGCRHTLTAWLGDLLVAANRLHRGQLAACATAAGLERGTLSNAKLVCSRIPFSCRHEALSWTHHCEVGLLLSDSREIDRWLSEAEGEKLSVAALRLRLRSHLASSVRHRATGEAMVGFRIMRDLRAAARSVEQHEAVWKEWSRVAACQALGELEPISKLLAALQRRAKSGGRRVELHEPPCLGRN